MTLVNAVMQTSTCKLKNIFRFVSKVQKSRLLISQKILADQRQKKAPTSPLKSFWGNRPEELVGGFCEPVFAVLSRNEAFRCQFWIWSLAMRLSARQRLLRPLINASMAMADPKASPTFFTALEVTSAPRLRHIQIFRLHAANETIKLRHKVLSPDLWWTRICWLKKIQRGAEVTQLQKIGNKV